MVVTHAEGLAAGLARDLAAALRQAVKRPGLSLAVALTLALGIGANTAIFGVVNGVILRPLPYPESERLYTMFEQDSLGALRLPSYPTFLDWHEQSDAFDGLAYVRGTGLTFQSGDRSGYFLAAFVSNDFFPTLRGRVLRGRVLQSGDHLGEGPSVAVLSHQIWQRVFGGDAGVIGRAVTIANSPVTIVGVLPPTFTYPNWGAAETDVWMPMTALPPPDMAALEQRDFHADSRVVARLRAGVALEAAQAQMHAIARRLAAAYPEASGRWTRVSIQSVRDFTVGDVRARLFLLAGAVAVVLLISCLNLANLYLAQGAARRREFAIRAALGAGRKRVLRQLLAETLVLAALGGAGAVVVAAWVVRAVRLGASPELPRVSEIGMDWAMLAFAAALTISTGMAFAAVITRRVASPELAAFLAERNPTGSSRPGRGRLPAWLLAAQVGLTVVLLVAGALLTQSFLRLSDVDPGFDPDRLVLTMVNPPSPAYDEPEAAARLYQRVAESVSTVPGVEQVAMINHAPVGGGGLQSRAAIGHPPSGAGDDFPVLFLTVSPGYFSTMGIPLLQGRAFTDGDLIGPPGPLIVSQALARRWRGRSPVGERLGVLKASRIRADFGEPLLGTVVGVVGDVRHFDLDADPMPMLYVPYTHNVWASLTLVARTAVPSERLLQEVDDAVRLAEPAIPLTGPGLGAGTMERRVRRSYAQQRFNAGLVSAFALAALLLAAAGIYGVMSYTVALETRDLGIRMALGAAPRDVLHAVVRRAVGIAGAGLVVGLIGALGVSRIITGLLFQVEPIDTATFAGVALLLMGVATCAAYLPARRAAKVDPVIALKA